VRLLPVRGSHVPMLSIAVIVLLLACVLDVARTHPDQVRLLPRAVWLVAILLLPLLGSLAWLVAGRPLPAVGPPPRPGPPDPGRSGSRSNHPSYGTRERTTPPVPRGPDDDPEFLRRLDESLRRRGGPPEGT
jgi:hypothetical protein